VTIIVLATGAASSAVDATDDTDLAADDASLEPVDENSPAFMVEITDALVATGFPELGIGLG
jgi:hypothetical protein